MNGQEQLEEIRNQNISDLLRVLREGGTCSLNQIAEQTNIGLTTVKKCMEQGLREKMTLVGEAAESTGGRKAQQYVINREYQYFLFLITDDNDLVCSVYDFAMHCIEEQRVPFEMQQYLNCVHSVIAAFQQRYEIGVVCLSLPCVVKEGVIMDWYYNPGLCGFDMQRDLEKRFHTHVIVQNDMKLTVIGASTQEVLNSPNIVTAQFGHNGIGVGEMVNGHVLEGASGFAGEVGYINDIRKNIMGTSYLAKIVRSVIICINPQMIVFYESNRQNNFQKIFEEATKGLPQYALPEYKVSSEYTNHIISGFTERINQKGFFRKKERVI